MACTYRLLASTLVSLLITACGEKGDADTDTSTTAGDSESTAPTTGNQDPACACIDPAGFGLGSYTCESGPCPTVSLECSFEVPGPSPPACDGGSLVTLDEAALNCALDQLIAGTPGLITYSHVDEFNGGGAFLAISSAGNLTRSYSFVDLGGGESPAGFVTLKDKAYFTACKAEPDVATRFLCFIQWSEDQPDATCDDASELSEQF